jgi:hypothetical protein
MQKEDVNHLAGALALTQALAEAAEQLDIGRREAAIGLGLVEWNRVRQGLRLLAQHLQVVVEFQPVAA